MTYAELLTKVIDNGIAAAREDYKNNPLKLEGAVAGFEMCRHRSPEQLATVLQESGIAMTVAHRNQDKDYWKYACHHAEVEWVCNCMSVVLPEPIVPTTARACINVGKIQQEALRA